jgi:hypothetical protein
VKSQVRAIGVLGASLALTAAALTACSSSSPSTPIGTVADTGFRPSQNGFSFQNYGNALSNGNAPTNLTAADVQRMFGDSVCADAQLRKCDLIPEAQAWLDSTNEAMAGGHCYGFSVLSQLIWDGKVKVSTLGAGNTTSLAIDNNLPLQRDIAYDWALQTLDSVQSERTIGSPNQILDKLRQVLKPNPPQTYTIAFWKRDGSGGHAVTPYAVDNKGGGKFDVLIYDNNWPGQTRAISFDTNTNTWTYQASTNPNEPDSVYEGDAGTKTLSLFPTTPGLGTQPCPFCEKVPNKPSTAGAKGNNEEISLVGSDTDPANLFITDDAGRRLGYINGSLVNEIPGAHVNQVLSNQDWKDHIGPNFYVPGDARYTITIDGTALTATDTETVDIIGPSFDVAVRNIAVHPGDKDTLVAEPDATKLSYSSSTPGAPNLEVGVSDRQANYAFAIGGVSEQAGGTINLGLPAEGGSLALQYVGPAVSSSVNFKMTKETEQGVQVFHHSSIPLVGGDQAQFEFDNWTSTNQGIPLVTSHNGQQSTQTLANQ